MGQKRGGSTGTARKTASDSYRAPGQRYSAEEKVRIVLKGLRSRGSITQLCRHENIGRSQYYRWSREFLKGGKERLNGKRGRSAVAVNVRGRPDLSKQAGNKTVQPTVTANQQPAPPNLPDCSLKVSSEGPPSKPCHHIIPSLSDPHLDAELRRISGDGGSWYDVAFGLDELRKLEAEYEAIPATKCNPDTIRRYATKALDLTFLIIDSLYESIVYANGMPTMLCHISVALEDLNEGLNSRILLTGTLAEKFPKDGHSLGWHRRVRGRSAAIIEFLLKHHIERTQMGAASRVARSLDRGGYAAQGRRKAGHPNQADTIKRWHNLARSERDKPNGPYTHALRRLEFKCKNLKDPHWVAEEALLCLEDTCRAYRVGDD